MKWSITILLVGGLVALASARAGRGDGHAATDDDAVPRLRRPMAVVLLNDGKRLLIANRDSGTVAMLDTQTLKVVKEMRVGRRLSDMAGVPGRDQVLVADESAGEVAVLDVAQGALRVTGRVKVGADVVGVRASADGELAVAACLWSRRLAIVGVAAARKGAAADPTLIDLPFAPRQMLALTGARMLVADSFGGELALVDLREKRVESVRGLQIHNIRGMALDRQRKGILLAHQVLYPTGRTAAGDIRSGNVIANLVRRLSLDVVLDPRADLLRDDWFTQLGDVERGAGDPAGVAELEDGRLVVALSGANEVVIGQPHKAIWQRLNVGARPTALVVDAASQRAYVANTFSDSISVVDLQTAKVIAVVRLGPPPELRAEERGEVLFHDARLSLEAWYSCQSCHTDGHTNGRLNDNFTDGSFGTPKRVLSLLGTKDTGPWAWHGRFADLESQIHMSVKSTMQGAAPTASQVANLTAYLRSLPPPPALLTARGTADAAAAKRGHKIFVREKCATCHAPPAYTSPKNYDVGLRDETGGTQFNPPSLRGVSQGGPYFHDGRAATLEEVFTKHGHPHAAKLGVAEARDLAHYLGGL